MGDSIGILQGLLIILLFFVSVALAAAWYCFRAFGQMQIARKLGHRHPFFAWVPFLDVYQLGEIAELDVLQSHASIGRRLLYDHLGIFLVLLKAFGIIIFICSYNQPVDVADPSISDSVLSVLFVADLFASLCFKIFAVLHTYKRFVGGKAVGYTFLYVFLPCVSMPIVANRNPNRTIELVKLDTYQI